MSEVDKNFILERLFSLPENSIKEVKTSFDEEGNFIAKMKLKTSFVESNHYIDNLILNNQI